jgi:hypothetical protein
LPRNNEKPSKSIKKSSDFHIAQKSWKTVKVFKNHKSSEIFTLPRNHEKPSVFENHEIFTLPRNH